MTGVPVQPVYPYPQDPKAGPAPPQPGFMYPPSGPAPQYPLYPAGPPVYNPAGEWAPPPACSALGVLPRAGLWPVFRSPSAWVSPSCAARILTSSPCLTAPPPYVPPQPSYPGA